MSELLVEVKLRKQAAASRLAPDLIRGAQNGKRCGRHWVPGQARHKTEVAKRTLA
jgi:hypothetical protein